ncbi:MAG: T9SS type A sorting domain-containing protein, partial [Candidatus Kapabacteria bacterium]|nr:T9SS type A sorting domain-containing protein [Candidatus Kapabacteria bacterium]
DYNPVTLNFQTPGTTQEVIVSAKATEPTVGRAGNPENALDLVYTIKPVGTDPNDALNATFATGTAVGTTGTAKRNIAAKWENDAWKDYRNGKSGANDAIINDYSIANSTALAGDWAVFSISQEYDNTDAANTAVDAAISTAAKNVVITNISPNPVQLNRPFTVTVQLQDQFGQPITTETPVNVELTKKLGATTTITDEPVKGVITAGSSFTTLTATASTAAGANIQLQADDDAANVYTPTVSKAFNVVADAPATQATIVTITPANTTADIAWTTSAATALIVLKAGEPLTKAEYPVNGTTYTADALYGAGSQIGDAVVVAKGATAAATVRSLSPNTTYYAYAFAFAGSNGTESYKLSAASGNPQAFTTSGSNDDDVAFGENNTRETSRTIGTNTPVKGTIKDATDEDWFNFSVSSANPNVRAQLSNLPAGYNVEIYNTEGKRIRRGIRLGQGSEGPVINGLAAGTYTLKIYSSDGSSSAEPYTLKVGTKSSEIFSVTP